MHMLALAIHKTKTCTLLVIHLNAHISIVNGVSYGVPITVYLLIQHAYAVIINTYLAITQNTFHKLGINNIPIHLSISSNLRGSLHLSEFSGFLLKF